MTDEERAKEIRAFIAGIERIKKAHAKGEKLNHDQERIYRRLGTIMKLYKELQDHGREDLWQEFRPWAETLSWK